MRLAIVGLDGVGKTTLSSYISKQLGIPVFKDNKYKEKFFGNAEYTYHSNSLLFDFIKQTNQNVILDRCFWDEYVYGTALGRKVDCKKIAELDDAMYDLKFSLVYVSRPNHKIVDDVIKSELASKLAVNYRRMLWMSKCNSLEVYNNFEYPQETLLDIITNHYK